MKTIELTKSAPRWKSVLAIADAAYEHDDDAAPKRVARTISRGRRRPSRCSISERETNACTAPEIPKPWTSAQRVTQNMKNASRSEWAMSIRTCMRLEWRAFGGRFRFPDATQKKTADEEHQQFDQCERHPVQCHRAERLPRRGDGEEQAVHRGLARPQPGGCEYEDDRDDRADRGHSSQVDDRHGFGMGADRAQQEPQREATEHPRARVEDEQSADRPSAHVRQFLRVAHL